MNERLKREDSKGEPINYLSGSDCIGLAYGAVTWWTNDSNPKTRKVNQSILFPALTALLTWGTNDSKNPKTWNRWTNSSTEPIGCCACGTERITPRDDSFFPSYIKDSFKMNESFKNDSSLISSANLQINIPLLVQACYLYRKHTLFQSQSSDCTVHKIFAFINFTDREHSAIQIIT